MSGVAGRWRVVPALGSALGLAALLALAAACTGPSATGPDPGAAGSTTVPGSVAPIATSSVTTSAPAGTADRGQAAAVTLLPAVGAEVWVECPGASVDAPVAPFRLAALRNPLPLDPTDPLAVAYRDTVLDRGETAPVDRPDARLVHRDDRYAVFARGNPPGRVDVLAPGGSGWAVIGTIPCPDPLRIVAPDGVDWVSWTLDPAAPVPGPDDTAIRVLVTQPPCGIEQRLDGRLLPPEVAVRGERVLVAIGASTLPPETTCTPGTPPPVALTVTLPAPLGGRALVDGTAATNWAS